MSSSANTSRRFAATQALKRYWLRNSAAIEALSVAEGTDSKCSILPPRMAMIALPEWAADIAPDGGLLVSEHCVAVGDGPEWRRVDWWMAIDWFLSGIAERAFEDLHGPIHSYSFRLTGWDDRLWSRAWVNRMALFLRRWAAREQEVDEGVFFGPLPPAEIHLTHDIDAISKTVPIRIKQSAFHAFNTFRSIAAGRSSEGGHTFRKMLQMAFAGGGDWSIDATIHLERQFGVRSQLNLFAGDISSFSPKRWLLNPSYSILDPALANRFSLLAAEGWTLGLHQSFDAWRDSSRMREERQRLESAVGVPVLLCRQHWLRFSWQKTWVAQAEAGLRMDSTLGFNDRPGFRNGSALCYEPRKPNGDLIGLSALPLVLMDSQLYDYGRISSQSVAVNLRRWIGEIKAVGGQASVLWHPHTLSQDYGWKAGFIDLLKIITE